MPRSSLASLQPTSVEPTLARRTQPFGLFDDGAHNDGAADDGLFGAALPVDRPGSHRVHVKASFPDGGAALTREALASYTSATSMGQP